MKTKLSKSETTLLNELSVRNNSEDIINPYSKDKVTLEPRAVALYDYIKGCEYMGLHSKMYEGINIFRKLYPNEYMILLD